MGFYHSGDSSYRLYTDTERRQYGERQRERRRKEWHAKWITKSRLKEERNWTDAMIDRYLAPPIKAGSGRHGKPIMAWPRSSVQIVERNAHFKECMDARRKRQLSRARTLPQLHRPLPPVAENAEALIAATEALGGTVERFPEGVLLRLEGASSFVEISNKRTRAMMKPRDRLDWILTYMRDKDRIVDVLNRSFVDAYIAATGASYTPMPYGAHKCPMLGRDLSALAQQGSLERDSTGIEGGGVEGFPKWVWVYTLPDT